MSKNRQKARNQKASSMPAVAEHTHGHHLQPPPNGESKAAKPPQTEIVVICKKCQRASQKFFAYDKDLAFNAFVKDPSANYGYCQCNEYWKTGLVIRNPDMPEAQVVILTYERDRLKKQLDDSKLRIESYERAMSLMSSSPFAFRMGPGY